MTTLYLNPGITADAAVTANTDTKWQLGFTLGASSTAWFTQTINGPTSGKQLVASTVNTSDSPATPVAFYSKPLQSVAIVGQINIRWEVWQSSTALNAAPCFRLERCSGDGTILSVIADPSSVSHFAGNLGTTSANVTAASTAANTVDTTLTNGDRLRLTLWIRDAGTQGGTGTMASGGYVTFSPNNTTGVSGSHSDASFTETLAQYTGGILSEPAAIAWSGVAPAVDQFTVLNGDGPPGVAFAGVKAKTLVLTPPAAVSGTGMFFATP